MFQHEPRGKGQTVVLKPPRRVCGIWKPQQIGEERMRSRIDLRAAWGSLRRQTNLPAKPRQSIHKMAMLWRAIDGIAPLLGSAPIFIRSKQWAIHGAILVL